MKARITPVSNAVLPKFVQGKRCIKEVLSPILVTVAASVMSGPLSWPRGSVGAMPS